MNDIYIFRLDKVNSTITLPSSVLSHISKYKNINKYQESYNTWLKLVDLLKNKYHFDNLDFSFKNEKPILLNSTIHFSISNSYGLGMIIISDSICGCDIEKEFRSLDISKKLLTESEYTILNKIDNKEEYLNSKWVIKESYVKYKNIDFYSAAKLTLDYNYSSLIFNESKYYYSYISDSKEVPNILIENI